MVDLSRQQLNNRPNDRNNLASYSQIIRWLGVGSVFVVLILAYSWNHMLLLDIQYQIEDLQRVNGLLRENNIALRAEYSSLANPEKIARKAAAMGLISSNRPEVTILQADTRFKVAQNLVAEARQKQKVMRE